MKKIVLAIVAFTTINASAAQYITEVVCGRGESGDICEKVTYKVRPASPTEPVKVTCMIGESGEGPCPKVYGVPQWLKNLNQAFLDAGFEAPAQKDPYAGQ